MHLSQRMGMVNMMMSVEAYVRQGRHTLKRWVIDPRMQVVWRCLAYFGAGFGLTAASLGNFAMPLAMGLVCAVSGWSAMLTAAGAGLGYFVFWGSAGYQGLVWVIAGLGAALFLGDRKVSVQTPYLMPAVAGFLISAAGVAAQLWMQDATPIPYYILRIALGSACTWVFAQVIRGRHPVLEWITWGFAVLALAQILPVPYLGLGYITAGGLAVASAFPAAALAGLALDLAAITPIPMTAVLCGAYLVRFLPRYPKWLASLAPCAVCVGVMALGGMVDITPLPGLLIGGIVGRFLPAPTQLSHRRGETGVAQVRLEMAAGVLAQTEQMLIETAETPVDEDALVIRAAERACAGCPCRKTCKDAERLSQLGAPLLHKSLITAQELPIVCRKSGRFLAEVHRAQEQLRSIRADRRRQQEYRAAVVQQYQFLATYLQDLSDQLAHRPDSTKARYSAYTRVFGSCPKEDNGDRCLMFPGTRCRYYVILCDGMGTGLGAVREARNAGNILQKLLTAGYPAAYALRTLNSLCALRERAGAVTVDLLELELDTGKASLYKWGAAPSYIVTNFGADRVGCVTPPPGLSVTDTREAVERFSLRRGELLVMVSDGVDQEAVLRCCQSMAGSPPGELGPALLTSSRGEDDATAVVIRLDGIK